MQKRVLFLAVCFSASNLFGVAPAMGREKGASAMGHIKNNSSFVVEDLMVKVRVNDKHGTIMIPQLKKGAIATLNLLSARDKSGKPILDNGEVVESMSIIKVQPKLCVNPLTNSKAKCRGRFKPNDDKRVYTIFDGQPGTSKLQRLKKGKTPLNEPQPRYVYVK